MHAKFGPEGNLFVGSGEDGWMDRCTPADWTRDGEWVKGGLAWFYFDHCKYGKEAVIIE